jgi:DNA modification methylase
MIPTEKPLDLIVYLLKTYTQPGEVILDNAFGSGTTLIAAQQEGRICIGIEKEQKYFDIACKRLKDLV